MRAFEGASNRSAVRLGLMAAAALCCLTISAGGALARATYTTFDAPNAGNCKYCGTSALYLNRQREIAGEYVDGHHRAHGFVRTPDGEITEISLAKDFDTRVSGLNADGVVAGYFNDTSSHTRGYLRAPDGKITLIDVPGAGPDGTTVTDLNDRGDVVGFFVTGSAGFGFIRAADGAIATFSIPNAEVIYPPFRINKAGVVTGSFLDSATWAIHGFIRATDGTITVFDAPHAVATLYPYINDRGEIAGVFQDFNGRQQGFLRSPKGRFAEFKVPNSDYTEVDALDNRGRILGQGGGYSFIRSLDGHMTLFRVPQSLDSGVFAIRGDETVGNYLPEAWTGSHEVYHSFIRIR
jgi:hypothetical protein